MRAAALAAALAAGALALSACGSSTGTDADPASVTPASAPLYVSVAIKPAGGEKGEAFLAAKALTQSSDPYASLAAALLSTSRHKLDYKQDLSRWIGKRAGVFVSSIDARSLPALAGSPQKLLEGGFSGGLLGLNAGAFEGAAQGAIVLDTSDAEVAERFLSARAREQQAHAASYRGVAYSVSPGGLAEGVVDRFAVIGSETGFKSVVDTSKGAANVTTAPHYLKTPSDAIATAYLRPQALSKTVRGPGASTGPLVAALSPLLAGASDVSVSIAPGTSSLVLSGAVHPASVSTSLFGAQAAQALGELPESAWLAAGAGNVGANIQSAVPLLASLGSIGSSTLLASLGGPSIERLLSALSSRGSSLSGDFSGWATRAGLFAGGTGLFNLEAGLVVDSRDQAASQAAVGKLGALLGKAGAVVAPATVAGAQAAISVKLQGFPVVLYVASGNSKLAIGLGQTSVANALAPARTLSGSSSYSAAASTLGEGIQPSLIVEFPTLVGFLEGIGLAQSQSLASLMPALKSLGTLTAGSVVDTEGMRFKLVLGLASA
jgi:Protein of unknown function (DUF3352)